MGYRLRRGLLLTEAQFDRTAERHFRRGNVHADQPMGRGGKLVSHLRRSAPRSQAVSCRDWISQVVFGDEPGEGAVTA